jgi:hypothetical protein
MGDFIESNDEMLEAQSNTLSGAVTGNEVNYNLTVPIVTAFNSKRTGFASLLADYNTARANAQAARAAKDQLKGELIAEIRKINNLVQAGPNVGADLKEAAGLPVHDENPSPSGPPTEQPAGVIEKVGGAQVVLKITNPEGSITKPAGTRAIQVFEKVLAHGQTPPTHVAEMNLVDVATSGRITRTFGPEDLCKTAYFGFRYVNAKGEAGPMSVIIPASIAA